MADIQSTTPAAAAEEQQIVTSIDVETTDTAAAGDSNMGSMNEEVNHQKNVSIDAKDSKEDSADGTTKPKGLLDGPVEMAGKRQRKTVERLVSDAPKKEKPAFVIEAGPGTKVADIPNVCHWIDKKKAADLVFLHRLMFGIRAKNTVIKKNIRQFSGFSPDKSEDLIEKRRELLEKNYTLVKLKELASWLDVAGNGTKSDVIDYILEFLKSPTASGNSQPKGISKIKSRSKKTKSTKKRNKNSSAPIPPQSALMMFAVSIRDRLKNENPGMDNAGLLAACKLEYDELDEDIKAGFIQKAKAGKVKYLKDLKAHTEEIIPSDDEDDAQPKTRPKKKRIEKKRTLQAEDSSEDDEPLVKKAKSGPSKSELRKCVEKLVKGADPNNTGKKAIRYQVEAMFPDHDISEYKNFIYDCIFDILAK